MPLAIVNPDAALDLRGRDADVSADHHGAADRTHEYSDIPGTPGHPADHDCLPCQILKYVTTFLVQPEFELSSPPAPYTLARNDWTEQQPGRSVFFLPQSRAPPQSV